MLDTDHTGIIFPSSLLRTSKVVNTKAAQEIRLEFLKVRGPCLTVCRMGDYLFGLWGEAY